MSQGHVCAHKCDRVYLEPLLKEKLVAPFLSVTEESEKCQSIAGYLEPIPMSMRKIQQQRWLGLRNMGYLNLQGYVRAT